MRRGLRERRVSNVVVVCLNHDVRRARRLGVVARGRLPLLEADRELLAVEAVERHPGADAVALVVAAVRVALAVDGEARLGVAEQGLLALRGAFLSNRGVARLAPAARATSSRPAAATPALWPTGGDCRRVSNARRAAPASWFKPRGKLTDFSFMAIARSIVACFSGAAFSFVAIKPWSLCSAMVRRDK